MHTKKRFIFNPINDYEEMFWFKVSEKMLLNRNALLSVSMKFHARPIDIKLQEFGGLENIFFPLWEQQNSEGNSENDDESSIVNQCYLFEIKRRFKARLQILFGERQEGTSVCAIEQVEENCRKLQKKNSALPVISLIVRKLYQESFADRFGLYVWFKILLVPCF